MSPCLVLPAILLVQATIPSAHSKRIVAKAGAEVVLWDSKQSARACIEARDLDSGGKVPARQTEPSPPLRLDGEAVQPKEPPPVCTSGVVAELAGGTLVVVVKGLPGESKKEKALKCGDLAPVRIVGGRHDGKIGCVADSALRER